MRQKCKCDIVQGVQRINLALMRGTSDTPLATSRGRKIGKGKAGGVYMYIYIYIYIYI